jgi:hypothetical protein
MNKEGFLPTPEQRASDALRSDGKRRLSMHGDYISINRVRTKKTILR